MSQEEELLRKLIGNGQSMVLTEMTNTERAAAERLQELGYVVYDLAVIVTQSGRLAIVTTN